MVAADVAVTPARRATDHLGNQSDHDLLVGIAARMATLDALSVRVDSLDKRLSEHLIASQREVARIDGLERDAEDGEQALRDVRAMIDSVAQWRNEWQGSWKAFRVGGSIVGLLVGILTIIELLIFFNSHIHIGFTAFNVAVIGGLVR